MTKAQEISDLEELLAHYVLAEKAVLRKQSYTIKDRTLTKANLSTIISQREKLTKKIARLKRGGNLVQLGVGRDY